MPYRFLILMAAILTMNACQSTPVSRPAEPVSTVQRDQPLQTAARARAQALFDTGAFEQALDTLGEVETWAGPDYLLAGYICIEMQDFSCAADALILAGLELPQAQRTIEHHNLVWYALNRSNRAPQVFNHPHHHAWWLLQQSVRGAAAPADKRKAWMDWRRRFPEHPAARLPPAELERLTTYEPPRMALFLPLSGPLRGVGEAVRDGLLAGYFADMGERKSEVRFYDTQSDSLANLYENALLDGFDVTVGPLLKNHAEQFAALRAADATPGLLLNYLDTEPPAGHLYQLGIAIEDEADALALKMLELGHERVLLVTGTSRWSRRATDRYLELWPFETSTASFTDIKNLTQAIGGAMQTEASENRKNRMARILGEPLEFVPRARRDLDAVISFTDQVESRALRPALQFHFADNLPVYTTSQATRGPDTTDLRDYRLTEMPLFVEPDASQRDLRDAFNLTANSNSELYALGFDAYRLASWIPLITDSAHAIIPGASGDLWLDTDGSFRRELRFATVTADGKVVPAN